MTDAAVIGLARVGERYPMLHIVPHATDRGGFTFRDAGGSVHGRVTSGGYVVEWRGGEPMVYLPDGSPVGRNTMELLLAILDG